MTLTRTDHHPVGWHDIGERGEVVFRELLGMLQGFPYIVTGGTALGIHRDERLIPTDTDIDVSMLHEPGLEERLKRQLPWPYAIEVAWDGAVQQMVWYPGVIVDVHLYRPDGGVLACRHAGGRLTLDAGMFEPEWRDSIYGPVPLPGDVEGFLEGKYGADWRTPQYRRKGVYQ